MKKSESSSATYFSAKGVGRNKCNECNERRKGSAMRIVSAASAHRRLRVRGAQDADGAAAAAARDLGAV